MAEYIEKSVLLEAFTNAEHPIQYPDGFHGLGLGYAGFREILFNLPAADVIERKKGKWLQCGKCSECGGSAPFWSMASTYYESDFCPHCGAKMMGEDNG